MPRNSSSADGPSRLVRRAFARLPFALLALLVLFMGCGPVARYRVLSFFFDGVPVPPQVGVPYGPPDEDEEPGTVRVARSRPATRPGQAEELPFSFLHAPFERRQCTQCHVRETSFTGETAWGTCRTCHADYYKLAANEWMHGPVAAGMCNFCHQAHKAQYPHLLKRPERELCFSCHEEKPTLAAPYHQGIRQWACAKCHDPHLAGNTLLIVDAGTYQRRRRSMPFVGMAHTEWTRAQCQNCHQSERSFGLIGDVEGKCVSCHGGPAVATTAPASRPVATRPAAPAPSGGERAIEPLVPKPGSPRIQPPPGLKLHKPVAEGKCTACHTAHKSPLPSLVRPQAQKLCDGCHPLNKLSEKHPKLSAAECLTCHKGHYSQRPHLLRESGQPFLFSTSQPTTQPATRPAIQPSTGPATQPARGAPRLLGPRPTATRPAETGDTP